MPDSTPLLQLTPEECRVLGTLIEKAQTTPGQYPLTLNGLTLGCNQKNNREPLTNYDEERVLDALDALKAKGLAREVMLAGSRVAKYRHVAREVLGVGSEQLVVLAELMLRGPQSAGELRGRASRMAPLASLEVVQAVLESLMGRGEGAPPAGPYVREIPPAPGSRATRYGQLLCPDLHPLDGPGAPAGTAGTGETTESTDAPLAHRLAALEADVAKLRAAVERIGAALGIPFLD